MSKRKVIVTCAVNGNAPNITKYPYEYPITPKQICENVKEVAKAGASVCHIHARDPETGLGTNKTEVYVEIVDRIRQSGVDMCINLTTGLGAFFIPDEFDNLKALEGTDVQSVEERMEHVRQALPEMASFNPTTANQVEVDLEYVYLNPIPSIRRMAKIFQELGVKPEIECYNPGDAMFANDLIKEGVIDAPPLFQFVMGIKYGSPADTLGLLQMKSMLPEGAPWTAFSIGRMQMPLVAQAVLNGGHVRVGLEDNHYLERGVYARNVDLVERAATIVDYLGCEVTTPAEVREMLNLRHPG